MVISGVAAVDSLDVLQPANLSPDIILKVESLSFCYYTFARLFPLYVFIGRSTLYLSVIILYPNKIYVRYSP